MQTSPAPTGHPVTITLPALLDQKAAAEYTGLSVKWFERDRWTGPTIPFVKMGRAVRYRAADLQTFIEVNTIPAKK